MDRYGGVEVRYSMARRAQSLNVCRANDKQQNQPTSLAGHIKETARLHRLQRNLQGLSAMKGDPSRWLQQKLLEGVTRNATALGHQVCEEVCS